MSLPTDPFLNQLGKKLRMLNEEAANDADWEAFEKLYHKPEKKRKAIWWWLPIGLLLGSSALWAGWNYSLRQTEQSIGAKQQVIQIKAFPEDKLPVYQEKSISTATNAESNKEKKLVTNRLFLSSTEKTKLSTEQESITKEKQKEKQLNALAESGNLNDEMNAKTSTTSDIHLINNLNWQGPFASSLVELRKPLEVSYFKPGKKKKEIWLDLGFGVSETPIKTESKNQLSALPTFGTQGGIYLNKYIFAGAGFSYSIGTNWNVLDYQVQTRKMEIDHIDTSLKFDPSAARIVMDMDTAWHEVEYTENKSIRTKHEVRSYSIPLIFGIEAGNLRHQLRLFGGLETGRLEERIQELSNDPKNLLIWKTKNSLLMAPLAGVSYGYKAGINWGPYVQARYRMATNQQERQSIQLMAGIRFNF
ncbi:MAG: hypothetical protein LCH37_12225 [Bacteroidetes bacterium]|nr:hypothetical protein [Bacteroidota bacterium]